MSQYLQYIVVIGAIVQFFGVYAYIRDTLLGKTKPNRVSWLLWAIAPLIATFAALSAGITWAVLPVFTSGFGPLLILLASFVNKKAYWKLEKLDYLCGVFSILALVLWGITKQPIIAIIFAILSDGFAAVPTLIKSWHFPETETLSLYYASVFNSLTAFFALKVFNFTELAFPIYLVLINLSLLVAVLRKKIFTKYR